MSFRRFQFAALALAACSVAALAAQSAAIERDYRVGSFDKIAAAGANVVIVHLGGVPSVRAQGPAETLDKMEVVVEHGGLQIRPRREFSRNFDWRGLKPATYTVTLPRLTDAALAGSGEMRIDRAEGDRFAATVAGSGNLDIAALRVGQAKLSMAGSGNLTARGSATRADLSVAGSGNVRAHGVASRTATVSIAGSGDAEITAKDTANVSIVGSGDALIAGGARCAVTRIGSGRAHCG
ncbi:MAG TPA: head GIN domain-containing protein [Croceibacterium sp.]|nr:head GIN domain-containing protein [Croceibacterium sp.]